MARFANLKPAICGAVVGAGALWIIGFSQFGWMLGSTAEQLADKRAQSAVVSVMGPICVERFRHQPDAPAKLAEFDKMAPWGRQSLIEKGGWATIAGSDAPNPKIAVACAEQLARPL